MNAVIDTRVSPQMRNYLLANRRGKLHPNQRREVVTEPIVTVLVLLVPAIILFRSFLLTLFVGGLWMVGVGAVLAGGILLWRRSRRYNRITIVYGIYHLPDKVTPRWMFWKPITLIASNGSLRLFQHILAPDRRFEAGQEYLVYYFISNKTCTLLSFASNDALEIDQWQPVRD